MSYASRVVDRTNKGGIPLIRLPSLRDPVKQNKAVSLTVSLIDVMLQ
jgi:hypothetical protein